MQNGPNVTQTTPRHSEKTPSGSQPAAATKPCTRGDLRTSRTIPAASARMPSPRTGAPSPSSCRSKLSSRRNQARDPNPSRDDSMATHPSPFKFIPRRSITESSAVACSTPWPRTAEVQGSTSIAHQADPSCCDQRDHILHGRNVSTAMPSRRSSPIEG